MNVKRATISIIVALFTLTAPVLAQTDPLPSWSDTPTKQAIVAFVAKVTQAGGADFVPGAQRVAVFDLDGTLVPEMPVFPAVIPVVAEIKEAVAKKPALGDKPMVAALLKGDYASLDALDEQGANDLIATATDGKTTEEIIRNVRPLLAKTRSEKFGVPYSRAVYRPMLELLAYLEANGFKNWICSGSPLLIIREIAQDMFDIPPERVMGSNVRTRLDERDGKTVLIFAGTLENMNDKDSKPVTIHRAIGMRPVFVAGNVGAMELAGAKVCAQSGTTTEANARSFFAQSKMTAELVTVATFGQMLEAYKAGRCDAITADRSALAAQRMGFDQPDAHTLLPEVISKEPLGPVVRRNDSAWASVVRWVLFALIDAEENGHSRAAPPPVVEGMATIPPLSDRLPRDWYHNVIRQVGNYGDIFERNLGKELPLAIKRGVNSLWTQGGILYAPPMR